MIYPEFKPSEVRMWRSAMPLIDCFNHSESEFAAALIVLACRDQGDEWQPVSPRQLGAAMKKAGVEGGALHHLRNNPFVNCDLRQLVDEGFAIFLGDPDGEEPAPIRFTEKGFERLRKTLPKTAP